MIYTQSAKRVWSVPIAPTAPSLNDVLTYDGEKWAPAAGGGSGANAALSNLASVSINASLVPQTTLSLGAQATPWRYLYLYGGGTFGSHSFQLTGTPTGHRVITLPDASITVAGSASALTSGRVPFATTGGLLTDSAGLTYDGTNLSVTAAIKIPNAVNGIVDVAAVTSGFGFTSGDPTITNVGNQAARFTGSAALINQPIQLGASDTSLSRISAGVVGVGTGAAGSVAGTLQAGVLQALGNGALSAPAISGVGTWITGGSSTTTVPYMLIQPTGTTSTGWSTSGTGLGVNAASGFAGNLLDLQVAASSKFSVTSAGAVTAANNMLSLGSVQGNGGGIFNAITPTTANTTITVNSLNYSTASRFAVALGTGTHSQTSGTNGALTITPTYNQASGTAANTDLLINRTETAVGSGAQNLIDAQVGGSSRFRVSNAGVIALNNGPTVTTGTGDPESVVTAPVGSIFLRTDGGSGTTLYVKQSGSGNTGWGAK